MGIALWIAAGAVASMLARMIRPARPASRWRELAIALPSSLLLGILATALDFGGWNQADWRAAAFACAGTLAVLAVARIARLLQGNPSAQST